MNFKVSVIVPVYNVYDYLDETIKSVISQSLNFEKNIELVLVNDGSPDKSYEICEKYKKLYPKNVIYIEKENSGVSDSRNIGFQKSTAPYVLFLDSDDLINKVFLKKLCCFLDKNKNINLVISRVRLFEAVDKWHYMDFTFKSNRKFADINNDITYLQYHSTGVLFRRSAIKKIRFDKNVKYGEDMKFMSEVLLQNNTFGLEKKAILYYRKRISQNSAVNTQLYDKSYYINTIKDSFMYIFKQCIKKYGYVTKYFQYFIMNSIGERVRIDVNIDEVLNSNEKKDYLNNLKYLLKHIDNDIIIMQKRMSLNDKVYFYRLKNGHNAQIEYKNNGVYLDGYLCDVKLGDFVKIAKIENSKNNLKFYLKINDYLFPNAIGVFANGKLCEIKKCEKNNDIICTEFRSLDCKNYYVEKNSFFELSKNKNYKINFFVNDNKITYGITSDVFKHNSWPKAYKKVHNKIVYMDHKTVYIKNKYQICKLIKYIFIDALVVLKRNGVKIALKKVVGDR